MAFKYAAFTVMMPEYTIEEAVKLLAELGYDGVEWRVHSVPKEMPAEPDFWRGNKATIDIDTIVEKAPYIKKIMENEGLECVGLGTYISYKMLDDVERCMEAACALNCGTIRVSTAKYDGSKNYNDLFEEAVDGYAKVEEIAKRYGVRACIELHEGNICSSASLGYRFVSNFDPDYVGIIYDPGNLVREGYENWQLGMELLGPYLSLVHVKNVAWVETQPVGDVKTWHAVMAPMKEGMVPWRTVLNALNKSGYAGWLSIEDFAPGDTKQKLIEDLNYLKALEKKLDE